MSVARISALSLVTAAALHSGAAMAAGDAVKGKTVFARCAICHSVDAGKNKLGPSLANIVGQKAGEVPGFKFSPVMKSSKIVWTPETLDKYLTNPRTFMPGNKMVFMGLPNPADRANVIAYLTKPVK